MIKTIKYIAAIALLVLISNRILDSIYVREATILFQKDMCGAFQSATKSYIANNQVSGAFPAVSKKDQDKYCVVRGLLSSSIATGEPMLKINGVGTFVFSRDRIIMVTYHSTNFVLFKNWEGQQFE